MGSAGIAAVLALGAAVFIKRMRTDSPTLAPIGTARYADPDIHRLPDGSWRIWFVNRDRQAILSVDAVNATTSVTVSPGTACRRPSVHEDASLTIASRPSCDAVRSRCSVRARTTAYPSSAPLDRHGVPQHAAPTPGGTTPT